MITYTNEIYLVFFLPLTLLAYEICPKRHRGKVLIAASYVFFYLISKWLFLYLLGVSVFIYLVARLLERARLSGKEYGKIIILLSILLPVVILLALKYTNFIGENVTRFGNLLSGGTAVFQPWSILLPIGISFYTLEAVGYLLDVWWGRIPAEKSLEKVLLFASNIEKYADRTQDVDISISCRTVSEGAYAGIAVENTVLAAASHEDSTGIGTRSMANMMHAMKGKFETEEADGMYRVNILFPVMAVRSDETA